MDHKELEPHQARVIVERDELRGRLDKLADFLRGSPALEEAELTRLGAQLGAMTAYLGILNMRIAAFCPEGTCKS